MVAEHGSGLGLGRTRRRLTAQTDYRVAGLASTGGKPRWRSRVVLKTSDAAPRSHSTGNGVGNGMIRQRRLDTSVQSTTDLCTDGSETDDDAEKVKARISADGTCDWNKNKYWTAKHTSVASAPCSELTAVACGVGRR